MTDQGLPVFRVMGTGSRRWRDYMAILRALEQVADLAKALGMRVVLKHGANKAGADPILDRLGKAMGFEVIPFEADWVRFGDPAGPIRNQQMVDSGIDLVVAFPDSKSKGTVNAMDRARAAGVPVWVPAEAQLVALFCTCGAWFFGPVALDAAESTTRNWYVTHCGPGHGHAARPAEDIFGKIDRVAKEMS